LGATSAGPTTRTPNLPQARNHLCDGPSFNAAFVAINPDPKPAQTSVSRISIVDSSSMVSGVSLAH
jgi:hypothetical protein